MSPGLESLRARIDRATGSDFGSLALEVFAVQRLRNPTYRRFLELSGQLDVTPADWWQIPCLPIGLFRGHDVRTGTWQPETTFRSSGTTGAETSEMPVRDLGGYRAACLRTFERLVGPVGGFQLLALLPGYVERGDSGLVAMVDDLVSRAAPGSGFYLEDFGAVRAAVAKTRHDGGRVLLWGVTFALLALAADDPPRLPSGSIVMETGGMKGRGPELTRAQLHDVLAKAFSCPIYSEYGMTELSSQAYLTDGAHFRPAHTLRARVRDLSDPFALLPAGRQGALNLYDLGNVDTCAFLQTDDLGRVYDDESFDVLGRADRSVARGCNLLIADVA